MCKQKLTFNQDWPRLKSSVLQSNESDLPILTLANHYGAYWPKSDQTTTLRSFIAGLDGPDDVFGLKGVGRKKGETILKLLLKIHLNQCGNQEDPDTARGDDISCSSPNLILTRHWQDFHSAIRSSANYRTRLADIYRRYGFKCPSMLSGQVSEVVDATGLDALVQKTRGLGKGKVEILAEVLLRLWQEIDPEGPAGPPSVNPATEIDSVLRDHRSDTWTDTLARVMTLAGVTKLEQSLVIRRYGFGGNSPLTLESLGQELGVTRERVRQLQAIAERKMRDHGVARAILLRLESDERCALIDYLVRESQTKLLQRTHLQAIRLTPAHRFLLAMVHSGSLDKFLDELVEQGLVQTIGRNWWLGRRLVDNILGKGRQVEEFLKQRGLPCPVALVSTKFEMTSAKAEDLLTALGFRTRLGLVFEKKLSAVERRSVFAVLVAVLEEEYVWNESDFFERAIAYPRNKNLSFRLFQRDLSAIDGLIVNTAGPYAILNPLCFEFFDKELAKETMGEAVDSSRRPEEPIEPETGITSEGLYGCLWEILENERILKFEQVEERFLATGRTSLGSVGPIMLAHSDIVRYAPGWWGRRGLSLTREDIELLCNPQDLRLYVEAKRGGGLLEMFRFWIPEMEYRWARWAENEADSELFGSLLVVIDPDDWPVPDPIRSQWKRKQEHQGFFRLGSPVPDFSNGVADFNSIYGLIALASERGELGYAGISHFLGWRFMNDRRAFSAIAFLVVLGILEETDESDQPHRATNEAEVVLRRFSETLMERPGSAPTVWRQFVRAKLEEQDPRENFGWFSMEEFATASKRWIDYLESDEITES
jgi:hypothetical protein